MAKEQIQTNKFGIPVHTGPVTNQLLAKRIKMIQKVIDTGRPLNSSRKLSKKDVYKASLNLYTYRWMLKKMANGKRKSTKKAS